MEDSIASAKIEVAKSETIQLRLSPETVSEPKTITLSILDATTAKFRTTSAIWFYQSAALSEDSFNPLSVAQLQCSLSKTLSHHPWLTGRLHWAHSPELPFSATSHDKRFRRIAITYGSQNSDHGASFVSASCQSHSLSEVVLPPQDRSIAWNPTSTGWTSEHFLPNLKALALYQFPDTEGCCLGVQITTFKCGGIAIGIAIPHQIADALTVTNFMRDWSRVNAATLKDLDTLEISPCFMPSLLDAKATGDIDAPSPDLRVISRARNLPMLRYDHWVDKKGQTIESRLPPELKDNQDLLPPHEVAIPWDSWDREAPVSYYVVHFTREEIENMYKAATSSSSQDTVNGASSWSPATRHDVLLAHLWQCISVARIPLLKSDSSTEVFLTMTMGLRARLSLPPSFVGSPILTTYISRPTGSFPTSSIEYHTSHNTKDISSIGQIASDIHRTQSLFTASAIGDALHDAAFDICPHRIWQTMVGSRHTLSTSWIHTHVYDDMDFGCAAATGSDVSGGGGIGVPWYVHPAVSKPDGQVVILEAHPGDDGTSADKWYHRGVDIGIALQEDVMQRMLSGDMLRRWQS